jgi:plastocyanin
MIGFAKIVVIRNVNLSMSPANANAYVGDTIKFDLESSHSVVEVSKQSYIDNIIKSNGGFSTPAGGGIVVVSSPGTLYYFCKNHGSFNMKGVINVRSIVLSNQQSNSSFSEVNIFPNPTKDVLYLDFTMKDCSDLSIKVKSMIGEDKLRTTKVGLCTGQEKVKIDASSLPNGLYFLEIQEGERRMYSNS